MRAVVGVVTATALITGLAAVPATATPTSSTVTAKEKQKSRDRLKWTGSAAQWVQHPYLHKTKNGRLAVSAEVYVDPFVSKKSRADKLQVHIKVAKKKYANPAHHRSVGLLPPHALTAHVKDSWTVHKEGSRRFSVTLPKKASNQLKKMTFAQRRAAVSIYAIDKKDTLPKTDSWGLHQVSAVVPLAKDKFSKTSTRRLRALARTQVAINRGRKAPAKATGAQLAWQGATPFYNQIWVNNDSPFTQSIAINPDIQCMWTGAYPNTNQALTLTNVVAGASVQFDYLANSTSSDWAGLNGATSNFDTVGSVGTGNLLSDLSAAASATESSVETSLENPATYSESGAATAAASAGLTFLVKFITGLFSKATTPDTCDNTADYPELFGISTQVTGFGSNNSSDADPSVADYYTTNYWNGWPVDGVGMIGGNTGPWTQPSSAWADQWLAPMLGAQTTVTYFWNGGQPAPMVSNNASGTTAAGGYNGGSATYEGGLMQVASWNPGYPGQLAGNGQMAPDNCYWNPTNGSAACTYATYGYQDISLVYLSNPNGIMGLYNQGTGTPQLSVTGSASTQYNLTCNLSQLDATLSLPFGSGGQTTNAQSTSMMTTPINSSGQLAEDGVWMVNFYGIANTGSSSDPTYEYVYYGDQWMTATPTVDGYAIPSLSPNADATDITFAAAAGSGSQTSAQGTVYPSDLNNMFTSDGTQVDASEVVAFGCNATPSVELPGLDIAAGSGSTIATMFGVIDPSTDLGWPMPGQNDGWPTSMYTPYDYQTDWSWQAPVNQLNLTYQGLPVGATPVPVP